MEENKNSDKHGTHWPQTPLCMLKKPTGDDSQRTVFELHTNYMNIVFANWFANKMFASVYTALDTSNFWDCVDTFVSIIWKIIFPKWTVVLTLFTILCAWRSLVEVLLWFLNLRKAWVSQSFGVKHRYTFTM